MIDHIYIYNQLLYIEPVEGEQSTVALDGK